MSHFHSYLHSAAGILAAYQGETPFASFLKKYFAAHKKFGSRDRKQVSRLCYSYFRLGRLAPHHSVEDRLLIGLFLCNREPQHILDALRPEWKEWIALGPEEKLEKLSLPRDLSAVFPWPEALSPGINITDFCRSFFSQPMLFLRVRPGKMKVVETKLRQAGLVYEVVAEDCLALANSSGVDGVLELDHDAVVQDFSSRRIQELMRLIPSDRSLRVWDACAASGGKSILAADNLNVGELTVSDIRESILANLRKRFDRAGLSRYHLFKADLTAGLPEHPGAFDLVIADVPCTGSGTWARTPEQLSFFHPEQIGMYRERQEQILLTVAPKVRPGGYLLYITCSVFSRENEGMAAFITGAGNLEVIREQLFTGYDKQADTLYAVLFRKNY